MIFDAISRASDLTLMAIFKTQMWPPMDFLAVRPRCNYVPGPLIKILNYINPPLK